MIAKGLKKGEVFEDGGLYYEVQSVLPNGHYVSKRVDKPKEELEGSGEEEAVVEAAPEKAGGKRK